MRQIFLHNYEGAFFCVLTIALLYVPSWVQVRLRIELPPPLEITILCFIFAAEILGEVNAFYVNVPNWDTMLHTTTGFLCAATGFALIDILNRNSRIKFHLSPIYVALAAFCFSMTVGVLWEFFEFGMDRVFHMDMQKDTIVHSVTSVMLDPTNSNIPVTIDDMTAIKPFSDEFADALRAGKIDNFYSCCAYLDHPDNYYFTWVDENGKNCACVFQATNSTLKIMKFHNRGTVVTPVQCVSAEEGKHNPAKDGVRAIATAGIKEMSAKQLRSKNSITAICTSAGIVVVLVAVLVVNGIVSGKAVDKSGRAYVGSACLDNLGQTETTAAE